MNPQEEQRAEVADRGAGDLRRRRRRRARRQSACTRSRSSRPAPPAGSALRSSTLQFGGQMFGDIASAFAAGFQKVMSKHETEADMAAIQAEYQRRREEWQHERAAAGQGEGADRKAHRRDAAQDRDQLRRAAPPRPRGGQLQEGGRATCATSTPTSSSMAGCSASCPACTSSAYKVAFDAAQQAERAFRFERGDQSSAFIEFSYWDSLKKGLFAGERLLLDLRRMEAAYVEGDRRSLEVTRHISLRAGLPDRLDRAARLRPLPDCRERGAPRRRLPGPLLPPRQDGEPHDHRHAQAPHQRQLHAHAAREPHPHRRQRQRQLRPGR